MKAEQSRTFATSIREEIVLVLKSFLKGQMQDAKKMMGDGYRLDYEMKLLFEKLEQVKKNLVQVSVDMEEANKTKEFLNSIQTKDVLHEEKKKAIAEKISNMMKYQEEQDRKLKQHIEEFNVFKTTFTNGANAIVDFFHQFDVQRMTNIRDSTMKYFVFEISLIRNLQYDVDKIVGKMETVDFAKEIADSQFYRYRKEPAGLDYELVKELSVKKMIEDKRNSILLEKTKIPVEDFGLGSAVSSFFSLFSGSKDSETKKKEGEKKFLEKKWDCILRGEPLTQNEEQVLLDLLAQDYNRKNFIGIYIRNRIKGKNYTKEGYDRTKDLVLKILTRYFNECVKNKDWENIRHYIYGYKAQTIEGEAIYSEIEKEIQLHPAFQISDVWVTYLVNYLADDNKKHLLGIMKHYVTDSDLSVKIIKEACAKLSLDENSTEALIKEYDDVKAIKSSPTKQNNFEEWVQEMEKKIAVIILD